MSLGDSGGPAYYAGYAYGIVSATDGIYSYYSTADRAELHLALTICRTSSC